MCRTFPKELEMIYVITVVAFVASVLLCHYASLSNKNATNTIIFVCAIAFIMAIVTASARSWSILDWLLIAAICSLPLKVVGRVLASKD